MNNMKFSFLRGSKNSDFDPQSRSLAISTHTLAVPRWFIHCRRVSFFFVNLWLDWVSFFIFVFDLIRFRWFLAHCSLCFVVVAFFPQRRFHHKEASSSIRPYTVGACVYSWMMFSATTWIGVYCKFVRNRPFGFLVKLWDECNCSCSTWFL